MWERTDTVIKSQLGDMGLSIGNSILGLLSCFQQVPAMIILCFERSQGGDRLQRSRVAMSRSERRLLSKPQKLLTMVAMVMME